MYTMVLMMAVTSGGDVSGFGHKKSGCTGAEVACHGGAVAHHGCTGAAPAACHGTAVGSSCHGGEKGGFLGLRGKLFGSRDKSSCHGNTCHGTPVVTNCCPPVATTGCTGGVMHMHPATTPPVVMPKSEDPKPKPKTEDVKPKTESN